MSNLILIRTEYYGIEPCNNRINHELNLQQVATNRNWLLEKVGEGLISQNTVNNLGAMMEKLQGTFPDLWDITVSAHNVKIAEHYGRVHQHYHPYGSNFSHEDFDEENYNFVYPTERSSDSNDIVKTDVKDAFQCYSFHVLIKFPEITITNTAEFEHTIRDLYMRLTFEYGIVVRGIRRNENASGLTKNGIAYQLTDNRLICSMEGFRETVTTLEFSKNYMHSHISATSFDFCNVAGGCCLGHGEIIQTMAMLRESFHPELFQLLIMQVEAYTKWESTEGGPYHHITNLQGGKKLPNFPTVNVTICDSYFKNHIVYPMALRIDEEEEVNPEINWKIEGGRLRVIDDKVFNDFCKKEGNPLITSYASHEAFFIHNGDIYDNQFNIDNRIPHLPNNDQRFFVFKGEKITLKVIPVESEVSIIPTEYVIHPQIKNHIKNKLEVYANYNKIKNYTIRKATQASNITENI